VLLTAELIHLIITIMRRQIILGLWALIILSHTSAVPFHGARNVLQLRGEFLAMRSKP
jgi:hypothetical protein